MVFGYQQGNSFSQNKQALGFDAANSEKLRLKQVEEQRKREIRMRAKQDIQTKEVRLRIIKDEINRRTMDLRRIDSSIVKLSNTSHVNTSSFDLKIKELKNKIRDLEKEIEKETSLKAYAEKTSINQTKELSVLQSRKKTEDNEITKLKSEERSITAEIRELERISI